jgi:hypothetical protein
MLGHGYGVVTRAIHKSLPGPFPAQRQNPLPQEMEISVRGFDHPPNAFVSRNTRQKDPVGVSPSDRDKVGRIDRDIGLFNPDYTGTKVRKRILGQLNDSFWSAKVFADEGLPHNDPIILITNDTIQVRHFGDMPGNLIAGARFAILSRFHLEFQSYLGRQS